MEYQVQVGDETIEVSLEGDEQLLNGIKSSLKVDYVNGRYFVYGEKSVSEVVVLERRKDGLRLLINGKEVETKVNDHISLLLDKLGMSVGEEQVTNEVLAPMPGVILDIMVSEGQKVKKGDPLLILEAMKMENLIKCPADVTVGSVNVSIGQNVEKNTVLLNFS
jgi:acetyl/propionyl-CoA carboxylase alpha subunit